MTFETITTQEQLNEVIGERLRKARESARKEATDELMEKFSDYDELQKKVKGYEEQIETLNGTIKGNAEKIEALNKSTGELQTKIKGYETASVKTRIAHEMGIPFEMASRLQGEDEDSIRKDAQKVAQFTAHQRSGAPLASTEPDTVGEKETAMKKMLASLKGE